MDNVTTDFMLHSNKRKLSQLNSKLKASQDIKQFGHF